MPIYTKRGDQGNTSTLDGPLSKSDLRVRAIGALDEANTLCGVAVSLSSDKEVSKQLISVQKNIFTVNSILAGANLRFGGSETTKLEKLIDTMDDELPTLKNFIFPGGTQLGATLHFTRAVIRRAERELTEYSKIVKVKSSIQSYINRLSDYIFTLARWVNMRAGVEEEKWS